MTTIRAIPSPVPPVPPPAARRIALLGNPNTGKTTLFNRFCGLRHKTANFPGTTLEARLGRVRDDSGSAEDPHSLELIDLPGIYSLELDQLEAEICRAVLAGRTAPRGDPVAEPDAVCVVADATNLPRNLMFVGEALRRRLPTVVAVNMIDLARTRGIHVDAAALAEALGCDVVCINARGGEGLDTLRAALAHPRIPTQTPPPDEEHLRAWADAIYERCATAPPGAGPSSFTDRADMVLTHPVLGLGVFAAVMAGLFWVLFTLAAYPMEWIETIFAYLGGGIEAVMPAGILRDLLSGGVVGGIAGTVVFLPQICLLFFVISLLEDTGYLARAAFVMDRALRPFGLPGHAFVPLLSSHACAIPGIMATRAIPDRRERLAAILVAPFMTCSARLPVYALVTGILFPTSPGLAALAFVGAYALGIAAGVFSSLIARRTILRGNSRPMALELPTYKWPSIRTALVTTWDRGLVFVKNAGTNILCICIVLWWLSSYPKVDPPPQAIALSAQAASLITGSGRPDSGAPQPPPRNEEVDRLVSEAERVTAQHAAASSFAGRIGRFVQPIFEPLGYDWKLSVGVITSFAAREVFASTMAVVVTGEEDAADEGVLSEIAAGKRDDGTPIFTPAVAWSLLVYYVLAMQCLPTLAVTARESGSWKWAALQQVWMSGMAYIAALIVFQLAR